MNAEEEISTLHVPTPTQEQSNPIQFSGKGSEYFGIWIVNLFLSIITLGIYSAWAKVRRMQYFYRHTTLAGANFDYLGNPKQILKGRVIAFALFAVYSLANHFFPLLNVLFLVLFLSILPIVLFRYLRFRLYNTSYRGLRFHFLGTQKEAYKVFLLWPILTPFTVGLLIPFSYQRAKAYQHNHSAYGQSQFSFHASASAFYVVYAKTALLFGSCAMVLGGIVFLCLNSIREALFVTMMYMGNFKALPALILFAVIISFFLLSWFLRPYIESRLQNLVWNNTRLGSHRFVSTLSARQLWFIQVTNVLGIVFTLGLFRPFAAIRLAKYRLESVQLVSSAPLEIFVAGQKEALGAMGEETADLFDIDIAL